MVVLATASAMLIAVAAALAFVVPKYADADSVKRLIQTADSAGYAQSKVAGFRTLSHNAEFYAPGRLIRNANGVQRRFEDSAELAAYHKALGETLLVLVPLKQLPALDGTGSKALAENGDLAIVVISGR